MRSLLTPRSGQAMVMTAIMMTVFFGMVALVVDLGVVFVQRRQQQNAADAASLGVAKQLAAAVGIDVNGNVNYVNESDATVMTRAQALAGANWSGSAATQSLGIEYLDCSGVLIRAAVAGASGSLVPQTTCMIRATGTSSMNTLFLRGADSTKTSTTANATATARIAPATLTSSLGDVWPITRWKNYPGAVPCWFNFTTPCVFWSNNGGAEDTSLGSWKEKIFLSQYSQRDCSAPYTSTPWQILTAYDTTRTGQHCGNSTAMLDDMEYWLRYGFKGTISIGNKIEIHPGGVNGTNLANAMRDYLTAAPEGTDPNWGVYRTVTVSLWEVADKCNPSNCNNISSYDTWPQCTSTPCSSPPDRVTIADLRRFRFYYNYVNSSEVRGHYLSVYVGGPPSGNGPPSGIANTVQMVN